ncbi:MAG: restriction endonuclease [Methanothrix sp.]
MDYGGSLKDVGDAEGSGWKRRWRNRWHHQRGPARFGCHLSAGQEMVGNCGREVVQAFAGSLEGHKARKEVLITTSQFSGCSGLCHQDREEDRADRRGKACGAYDRLRNWCDNIDPAKISRVSGAIPGSGISRGSSAGISCSSMR